MILLHAGNDYTLEDSTLTVHFDNRLPAISAVNSDGTEGAAVPPVTLMDCRDAEDAYYRAPVVAVMKKNADSLTGEVPEQRLIYLRFRRDLSGGVWETMTAMDRSRSDNGMAAEEFTTGRQEIRTEDILELMVTWPVSMPTGDSSASWAAWTPRAPYYDFVDMSNGFRLKEISADELEIGPVWVQIVMTDTHNREHALTLVPVQPGEQPER